MWGGQGGRGCIHAHLPLQAPPPTPLPPTHPRQPHSHPPPAPGSVRCSAMSRHSNAACASCRSPMRFTAAGSSSTSSRGGGCGSEGVVGVCLLGGGGAPPPPPPPRSFPPTCADRRCAHSCVAGHSAASTAAGRARRPSDSAAACSHPHATTTPVRGRCLSRSASWWGVTWGPRAGEGGARGAAAEVPAGAAAVAAAAASARSPAEGTGVSEAGGVLPPPRERAPPLVLLLPAWEEAVAAEEEDEGAGARVVPPRGVGGADDCTDPGPDCRRAATATGEACAGDALPAPTAPSLVVGRATASVLRGGVGGWVGGSGEGLQRKRRWRVGRERRCDRNVASSRCSSPHSPLATPRRLRVHRVSVGGWGACTAGGGGANPRRCGCKHARAVDGAPLQAFPCPIVPADVPFRAIWRRCCARMPPHPPPRRPCMRCRPQLQHLLTWQP